MIRLDYRVDFEDILAVFQGLHVLGKVSWKNRKVGKFQVEKSRFKLENIERSWNVSLEIKEFL